MCVPTRFMCLSVLLVWWSTLVLAQEGPLQQFLAQEGPLQHLLNNRQCGRRGLCPYVKRLIPHQGGYSVDHGHVLHSSGQEPPSLCGNLCTSDHSCPGYQKCCPTHCGYACFDPVYVSEL